MYFYRLGQRTPALFLVAHYPACFICFPASTHLIQIIEPLTQKLVKFSRSQSMTDSFQSGVSKEGNVQTAQDSGP